MLILRATKKLRDRLPGDLVADGQESETFLGDWFATVLFWKPQVVLLVNARTYLPVFLPLAPAKTLQSRIPAAISSVLAAHRVDPAFIATETQKMDTIVVGPTNNRSVVGVMNEYGFLAEHMGKFADLVSLSVHISKTPIGPLRKTTHFSDKELASVVDTTTVEAESTSRLAGSAIDAQPADALGLSGDVFQMKVTLADTKPPIWRRILVDGDQSLDHLHEVIQAAFGWWNYHLHEFEITRVSYGISDPDFEDFGGVTLDKTKVRIGDVIEVGMSFDYTYDFGDNWRHKVVVEKVGPAPSGAEVPGCIAGRRACPPEDCGGPWSYEELLAGLKTGKGSHPALEMIEPGFDPEVFDLDEFAQNLSALRLSSFDD